MKIDPNILIGTIPGKTASGKQTGSSVNAFEDILKGVQGTQSKETGSLQAPYAVNPVDPQKINALSVSEQAIEMLDAYSRQLADTKLSLKEIEPMVDELSGMRSKLLDAGSFLSDSDPLKGIMDEVASTISGEVLRFRRGDLIG